MLSASISPAELKLINQIAQLLDREAFEKEPAFLPWADADERQQVRLYLDGARERARDIAIAIIAATRALDKQLSTSAKT